MPEISERAINPWLREKGIHTFERFLSPGFTEPYGLFEHERLCYTRHGRSSLILPDRTIAISENQLIYIPSGAAHYWENQSDNSAMQLFVCFYPPALKPFKPAAQAIQQFQRIFPRLTSYDIADAHRKAGIFNSIRLMRYEQRRAQVSADAMIWAQLIELLVMLTRARQESIEHEALSSRERTFARSLKYLREQLHEPLQIKDLAEIAVLSYRRYTQIFKEKTGKTVNQYIRELRIEQAKTRLLETENILHASIEAGFGDLAHFYRVFKAATGLTPRKFIASNRNL